MNFGLIYIYYEQSNKEITHYDVLKSEVKPIIFITITNFFCQYVVALVITYYKTNIARSSNQIAVAKATLDVILNNLNEAIVVRTV